tara:strand:+ start:197 stop:598 length:402 start_codon:yes stop_codon:yes gene_type:complete
MNKVLLMGRLGKDPEAKQTRYKNAMTKFSLATTEMAKDDEGNKTEKTVWHNIVSFNRQAETAAQFLKKGSQVVVDGKLVHRSWEGDDGQKKYATEIHANVITFCGSPGKKGDEVLPPPIPEKEMKFTEADCPF